MKNKLKGLHNTTWKSTRAWIKRVVYLTPTKGCPQGKVKKNMQTHAHAQKAYRLMHTHSILSLSNRMHISYSIVDSRAYSTEQPLGVYFLKTDFTFCLKNCSICGLCNFQILWVNVCIVNQESVPMQTHTVMSVVLSAHLFKMDPISFQRDSAHACNYWICHPAIQRKAL